MWNSRRRVKRALAFVISSAMLFISSSGQRLVSFAPLAINDDAVNANGRDVNILGSGGPRSAPRNNANGTQARANETYAKLPLSFEKNDGQFESDVRFVSHAARGTLFLTSTEAVMTFRSTGGSGLPPQPFQSSALRLQLTKTAESKGAALRMKLLGANEAAKGIALNELPGKSNYFIGNDPNKWRTGVSNYAEVTFRSVYKGIDLVYHGEHGNLEYDFNLAPGANPEAINLTFEGAERARINEDGEVLLTVAGEEIHQHKPTVYQEVGGARRQIAARYVTRGMNRIGFRVAPYDETKPLVIDPVLDYSTYLGGSGFDGGASIAVDAMGNAYVAGTSGGGFPVTPGSVQLNIGGDLNVFIAKLNATGSALVYSTFFGGSISGGLGLRFNVGLGVAVDSAGSAYVTGYTTNRDFPVTSGAFQRNLLGSRDAFVTKLNPSGSALAYSTYLGGGSSDGGFAIAVNSSGNAYVTGVTGIGVFNSFPTTPGAFQSAPAGNADAFLSELDTTGAALVYSTYLGGGDFDEGLELALDRVGNVYITGTTASVNFPTSPGAFQPFFAGGANPSFGLNGGDVFVTKLDAAASGNTALKYSTYLGGSNFERGNSIAVDSGGNAFLTGLTRSSDFPTTTGPFQRPLGGDDAFVTKLNATGTSLTYSGYLGGVGSDEGYGIAIDSSGSAYVAGYTKSGDFPRVDPLQSTCNCSESNGDAFLSKLNSQGSALVFSTYLGGSRDDAASALALDINGSVYVTGQTDSLNFPTTPGAFQTAISTEEDDGSFPLDDAFVAKVELTSFDICLQDETSGLVLRLNSATGDYQFVNCSGLTLSGTGVVSKRGCLITLQVNGPDRRVLARIDACMKTGSASIQLLSQGITFNIIDRNTANNSCACAGN